MKEYINWNTDDRKSILSGIMVRNDLSLYDALCYMTRCLNYVYLIRLKDGRFRANYKLDWRLFESDTDIDALYKTVMWYKENEPWWVIPPKKPDYMMQFEFDMIYGKKGKPNIKYTEL